MVNSKPTASVFYVESELADWSPEERQRRVSRAYRVILDSSGQREQQGKQEERLRADMAESESLALGHSI